MTRDLMTSWPSATWLRTMADEEQRHDDQPAYVYPSVVAKNALDISRAASGAAEATDVEGAGRPATQGGSAGEAVADVGSAGVKP